MMPTEKSRYTQYFCVCPGLHHCCLTFGIKRSTCLKQNVAGICCTDVPTAGCFCTIMLTAECNVTEMTGEKGERQVESVVSVDGQLMT